LSIILPPTNPDSIAERGQNAAKLGCDFVVTRLGILHCVVVHFVDGHDQLLNSEGVREKGVFAGLTELGNAGLEATARGINDKDGSIRL
jgi:hypothetical protein